MPTVAPAGNGADNGDFGSRFNGAAQQCADQECAGPCTPAGSGAMDDSLAGGAPGGSIAGGEFNVTALLALDAEAGSGGAGLLLGGAEKLACRSQGNSPIEGAGARLAPRHCLPRRRTELRAEWSEPLRGLTLPPARPLTAGR